MELWGPSARLGLRPPRDPRAFSRFKTFAMRLLTSSMDSGDGQIEILSVASTLDYARAATVRWFLSIPGVLTAGHAEHVTMHHFLK